MQNEIARLDQERVSDGALVVDQVPLCSVKLGTAPTER